MTIMTHDSVAIETDIAVLKLVITPFSAAEIVSF